jgi:hypothetical protein
MKNELCDCARCNGTYIQLAIVGSRLWNDYEYVKSKLDEFVKEFGIPNRVISGNAIGIDKMAERWAKENNIEMCIMKPKYKDEKGIEQFGKKEWLAKPQPKHQSQSKISSN